MTARHVLLGLTIAFLFSGLADGWSQHVKERNGHELLDLSIEELMETRFVTVLKKPGSVFESPAAVCVLTSEDIEHIGANGLPQTLRAVPGMQVARHNAHSWAITLRGFSGLSRGVNGQFANKLLVLDDGRSIYTPLFSGVSWEAQDFLLEDIERIEVIRGPGAALWGANAVNGIINVISKSAEETQGGLVTLGGGTQQRAFGHLRYGGKIGDANYFRVYAKYLKVDDLVDSTGQNARDGWDTMRGGFRLDSNLSHQDQVTVEAEAFDANFGQQYSARFAELFGVVSSNRSESSGGHVIAKWRRHWSAFSDTKLQLYFDRVDIKDLQVKGRIDAFDVEFQHRFLTGRRHDIIWGAGFRLTSDRFDSTRWFSLSPNSRKVKIFSAFVQDDISFFRNRMRVTFGSKFEHNDYTGFEIQPNVRVLWRPSEKSAVWGALSRAVRTPSRSEADGRFVLSKSQVNGVTQAEVLFGNDQFGSESLMAAEIGGRLNPTDQSGIDLTLFYNAYRNLRGLDPEPLIIDSENSRIDVITPLFIRNIARARTCGFELTGFWHPVEKWRVITSYSYLDIDIDIAKEFGTNDPITRATEKQSPRHQIYCYSSLALTHQLSFDASFRYVDALPAQRVDAYATADAQLLWKVSPELKFAIVGQNLLQKRHPESSTLLTSDQNTATTVTLPSEVQRGVFSKLTYQF